MKSLPLFAFLLLPVSATSETLLCLPHALDGPLSVRFEIDEDAQTVTIFQTGQEFILVENTPEQVMFEEGEPHNDLTLHYIAKAPQDQTGGWVSDTIGPDGNTTTTDQGVCYVL